MTIIITNNLGENVIITTMGDSIFFKGGGQLAAEVDAIIKKVKEDNSGFTTTQKLLNSIDEIYKEKEWIYIAY